MAKKSKHSESMSEEKTEEKWDAPEVGTPESIQDDDFGAFHVYLYTLGKHEEDDAPVTERTVGHAKTIGEAIGVMMDKGKEKLTRAILSNKYRGIELVLRPDVIYDAKAEAEFKAKTDELARVEEQLAQAKELIKLAKERKKKLRAELKTPKEAMEESLLGESDKLEAEVSEMEDDDKN